jgi:molybdopterin-guanine dinucleotide biosynthesis protein A
MFTSSSHQEQPLPRLQEWERMLETCASPEESRRVPGPPLAVGTATQGVSAIILAGGLGRRLGQPKALLSLQGRPVIQWIMDRLQPLCDEFIVVTAPDLISRMLKPLHLGGAPISTQDFTQFRWPEGAQLVVDQIPGKGPLGGILTGLAAASHPWTFVVSCDSPFASARLARLLLRRAEGADVVVPEVNGSPQPLLALYRQGVGPRILQNVRGNRLKMRDFLKESGLRVHTIPEAEWMGWGVPIHTFLNINTPADLEEVSRLLDDPAQRELLDDD